MTIVQGNDGNMRIGKDFVEAVTLPKSSKCFKAIVGKWNWLVAAETMDEAQRKIVSALASEGIKSTGAGMFQLAGN